MGDVAFLGLILVLFAASVLLVRACERIVGRSDVVDVDVEPEEAEVMERAA